MVTVRNDDTGRIRTPAITRSILLFFLPSSLASLSASSFSLSFRSCFLLFACFPYIFLPFMLPSLFFASSLSCSRSFLRPFLCFFLSCLLSFFHASLVSFFSAFFHSLYLPCFLLCFFLSCLLPLFFWLRVSINLFLSSFLSCSLSYFLLLFFVCFLSFFFTLFLSSSLP